MVRALQASILINPSFGEGSEPVGTPVFQGDPLAGLGVLPEHDVPVQQLERRRKPRIEVLHQGDRVPMIPPRERVRG